MSGQYHPGSYELTIQTDDFSLAAALRGFAWSFRRPGEQEMSCDGTGKDQWRTEGHRVTFRFGTESRQKEFIHHARRLFTTLDWTQAVLGTGSNTN